MVAPRGVEIKQRTNKMHRDWSWMSAAESFAANGNASAVLASKSGAKASLVKGFAGYPWINRSRYGGGKQNYRCHPQMWILGFLFFQTGNKRGSHKKKKTIFLLSPTLADFSSKPRSTHRMIATPPLQIETGNSPPTQMPFQQPSKCRQ